MCMGLVGGKFEEGEGHQTMESLVLCILSPVVTSQCPSHQAVSYFLILKVFIVPNFHDTHSPVILFIRAFHMAFWASSLLNGPSFFFFFF